MTAWIGRGATLPADALMYGGEHPLLEQAWAPRELLSGSVNADGWGVAWWPSDERTPDRREGGASAAGPLRLARTEPAWYDPGVRDVLAAAGAGAGLAALRNATPGSPVDAASVPPLTADGWAFVLNGYVPDFHATHMRGLRSRLPDRMYARLRGSSDAETLFLLVLDALEAGAEPGEALRRTGREVAERVGSEEAHFTCVLTDGRRLAACRASTVDRTNSLYVRDGWPDGPDGTVLASEPLGGAGWEPLPAHTLLEVDAEAASRRSPFDLRPR